MSDYLVSALSSGVSSSFSGSIDNIGSALSSGMNNMQALSVSAINRGAEAARNKNYDLSVQEFKRAIAYDPTNTDIYSYMGQVFTMMGQPDDAIKSYKKGLQVDPTYDDMRNSLANVYIQQQDYNSAEKELLTLEQRNPQNAGPPTTLGHIYLQQGRLAEADTQFTSAIHMAPTSSTAYYNLGLLRNKQGNYEDAVRQFDQALQLDPGNENAMADLSYAYMGLNDPTSAKVQYQNLLAIGTSSSLSLAGNVAQAINTPKMLYEDPAQSKFSSLLGPGTSVSALDSSLATPNSTGVFKMSFVFNNPMDVASVINPMNWTITKANGGDAGVYNSGGNYRDQTGANIAVAPLSVTYNAYTQTATVYFRISQNAAGNATIDPKHWVFQFNGKDAYGRAMDKSGNQYDGAHIIPF